MRSAENVPDRDPPSRRSSLAVGWVLFAAWAALLALPVLQVRGPLAGAGLAAFRSASELLALALRSAAWLAVETLRLAPLGFLAVLGLPDRARRRDRLLLVALPALGAAIAGSLLAGWLATRIAGTWSTGIVEGILALPGAVLGTAAGLAWRRGRRARLLFLPKLAAVAAGLLAAAGGLGWLAIQREPLVPEPVPITSADKVHLHERLRGKHPREIPAGETRTVRLDGHAVDRLLAWVWAIQRQGRATVRLEGPGVGSGAVSVRVPRTESRWVNAAASFRLRIDEGAVDLTLTSLRLGRLVVPRLALAVATPVLLAALQSDPRVRGVLRSIRSLRLEPDAVTCTFGPLELPRGQLPRLVWGEDTEDVRTKVGAQVEHLLVALERAPPGDERFAAGLEAAFAFAAERSRNGSALEENRAALLALGVVLGHDRIASVVGVPLDERRVARIRSLRAATTVRGRADWVRHFTVSCALTVLASQAPSDAAGLYKEEKDAFGGSGFSFGDLLADRAGTTFAEVSTRDEAAAVAMQERLARGARIEELFPAAADLPEGIPDAELEARYGGVGGPLYRRYADEIERRLGALAAYQR